MTAFERAEEIAASIDHAHPGPNDPCAIRDRIMSAIHEERAELSRMLELAREREKLANDQIERLLASVERLTDRSFWLEKEAQSIHGLRVKEAEERKVVDLQVELWKRYATLISQEFRETVDFAILHGWVSSRVEAGKELRAKLGIGDDWSEKRNEPVDACTTEGRPMNEMIPPIGGENRNEATCCGHPPHGFVPCMARWAGEAAVCKCEGRRS